MKGSQAILQELLHQMETENLQDKVSINASFCFEKCDHGPTVSVDGHKIQHCTPQAAKTGLLQKLKERQEKQL